MPSTWIEIVRPGELRQVELRGLGSPGEVAHAEEGLLGGTADEGHHP